MYSEMHCTAVTYFLTALATILSQSAGELIIAPRNTESKVGETTYFNCSTDLESVEIFWYHGSKYIYNGHGILEPYNGRFEIDRNASIGSHNLVIHSVEPSDAGEYICNDDDGSGTRRSAQLVVLDNGPDCHSNIQPDGVIGQNIFNIPPDEVQLTCTVTYHNDIPPQMEWKKVGENSSIIIDSLTSTVRSINRLIYTLKFKGDISLDKSSYVCRTTKSTQRQYNCTSEIIKILYFVEESTIEQNVVRGDRITCIATNSTFPCTSQWYHDNYTCPLSCDETITTHLLGEYLCTVKCHVRGRDYYFEALKAFVVEPITYPLLSTSAKHTTAVGVSIFVIIILAVSIAVLLVVYLKKRKYKRREAEEQDVFDFLFAKQALSITHESEGTNDKIAEEKIELIQKIKKDGNLKEKKISGVAMLDERLFVAREKSSMLRIYNCNNNCNNFHDCKLLKVDGLVSTYDMCSCKKNYFLYIMVEKTRRTPAEVLRIRPDGNISKKWFTMYEVRGYLSATVEGNLILTSQERRSLIEYSCDGELVRQINLPECTNPLHAIKRDDCYIVCHGMYFDGFHRVCLVDKNGKVEKSFGCESGSTQDKLNMPCYLAVRSDGCVMVADYMNSRVLLLDSDLKFKTSIVPRYKQRFLGPLGMCLNDDLLVLGVSAGVPVEVDTSTESDDLRRKAEDGKIDKDCQVLVFNIQPLLKKNDNNY